MTDDERANSTAFARKSYMASRIDGFLDTSLVFARDSQIYLLSLRDGRVTKDIHARTSEALHTYLSGLDRALFPNRRYLAGDTLSIADICVVAELALLSRESGSGNALQAIGLECITGPGVDERYPLITKHFHTLCRHESFAPDVLPYLENLAARS